MGGNTSGGNSRYIDLAVAVALLIAVIGAYDYYSSKPVMAVTTTALIVPGQSTRW
jgi:hypothetical protein